MVGFLVFWQVAPNPRKEIKFQQSHARTCVQGIDLMPQKRASKKVMANPYAKKQNPLQALS
jgi:hypothetical protein